jgi:hypothetical protein
MPVILATWEAEIRRIAVSDQRGRGDCETPYQEKKAGHGGVHQLSQQQQET